MTAAAGIAVLRERIAGVEQKSPGRAIVQRLDRVGRARKGDADVHRCIQPGQRRHLHPVGAVFGAIVGDIGAGVALYGTRQRCGAGQTSGRTVQRDRGIGQVCASHFYFEAAAGRQGKFVPDGLHMARREIKILAGFRSGVVQAGWRRSEGAIVETAAGNGNRRSR